MIRFASLYLLGRFQVPIGFRSELVLIKAGRGTESGALRFRLFPKTGAPEGLPRLPDAKPLEAPFTIRRLRPLPKLTPPTPKQCRRESRPVLVSDSVMQKQSGYI